MSWIFLDVAGVEAAHKDMIEKYGGSHGLRDEGLLASAVKRAENKANYDPDATAATIGASLSFGLIQEPRFYRWPQEDWSGLIGGFSPHQWLSARGI